MKQPISSPKSKVMMLAITGALLAACGGGSSGAENASQPLHEQQPSVGAPAASALAASETPTTAASTSEKVETIAKGEAASAGRAGTPSTPPASSPISVGMVPAIAGSSSASTADRDGSAALPNGSANDPLSQSTTGQASAAEAAEAPNVEITSGSESSAASTLTTTSSCVINETRNYGGSCWANIKATMPSGTNRSFPNARLNYTGSVNANCISGKVHWSTGTCKSQTVISASETSALSAVRPTSTAYKIGTFYFPGWRDNQAGAPAKYPWTSIKSYPEREPRLGWYDDGSVAVVEQQLEWMRIYGIDYVVFDWFWNGRGTELDHSLNAYLKTETRRDIPFALLWSNHTSLPRTKLEFTSMVDYWISKYFSKPEFMKIDGKPVIFVFSHLSFVKQAAQFGETPKSLLAEAEARARAAGHKGIYFVGGTHVDTALLRSAATSGYSAFSAYNYHGRADDSSVSFGELDSAYQHIWNAILKESSIPYILPITQGWDKRPWGGSPNPLHDMSGGVLPDFERHLMEARRLMDAHPTKTMKTGVICCWNEFGEGSFIEPTKKDGFSYLEKVQKVFGSP